MSVDTPDQLEGLRRAGRLVAATLRLVKHAAVPGASTAELDAVAADFLAEQGARSGPILTYGYPGSICVSVEDEVVHGIPGPRLLQAGQVVTLDVAAELDGYHADAAITVAVGRVDRRRLALLAAGRAALAAGIRAAQPDATLRDVGAAIERTARARGLRVFRELTGHGIGRAMHEEPTVPNWAAPLATQRLQHGLVFTIEPMLGGGGRRLVLDRDGWTVRTADHSLSTHEEHTIMVAAGGPVVLTGAHSPENRPRCPSWPEPG
ncbi:MAG: type I methionyl aminopeptidase [Actinomycetota bacterium]|nr:type I methionyl aminopeptidase [Actinomycetota bacterium]